MDLLAELETWTDDQPKEVAAAAIAAIGLLQGIEAGKLDAAAAPDEVAELCLGQVSAETGRAQWGSYRPDWRSAMKRYTPGDAADCWRRLLPLWRRRMGDFGPPRVSMSGPRLRLQIIAGYMNDERASRSYGALSRVLLGSDTGLDSAYFEWWDTEGPETRASRAGWHWPLRIGFLPDDESRFLRDAFLDRSRSWYGDLVDAYHLTGGVETCDLLVSPLPVSDTLEAVRSAHGRATALLLLGDEIEPSAPAFVELAKLRALCSASVLISCATRREKADLIMGLVEELSHNEPLDTAVRFAAHGQPTPLVISERHVIESIRLSSWAARAAGLLARRGVAEEAADLRRSIPDMVFQSESGDATNIARWARKLDEKTDFTEARYLQAETYRARAQPASRFDVGRWHLVEAFIGPWRRPDAAAPSEAFPKEEVRYSGGVAVLTIALTAPGCSVATLSNLSPWEALSEQELYFETGGGREAASCFIELWPTGRSSSAFFALRPERPGRVDARLLVAHNNRILQTALLSAEAAQLAEGVESVSELEEGELRFVPVVVEGMTRADLVELDERGTSDAAFLINRSGDGLPGLTSLSDAGVKVGDFSQATQAANTLRVELETMVEAPTDFSSADSEALRQALVRLALEGTRLYKRMVVDEGLEGKLGVPGSRVQLVSAKPESWVPLEFVYDGEAPEDHAVLCPNRAQALEKGSCTKANCEHADSEDHVCPARFWGLNRVIERHMFDPKNRPDTDRAVVDASLTLRPRIGRPENALFAYHERAGKFSGGKQELDDVETTLAAVAIKGAARVDTWPNWIENIKKSEPGLLVVLPHTGVGPEGVELLIADGADPKLHRLVDARVKRKHVGKPPPKIVLLLGCATSDVKAAYASFPAAFRHAEASIVVATLTSVLGRHATPVAKQLAKELANYWSGLVDPATVGTALTAVRRNLVASGLPFGMVLVAYGDADWVIG